VSSTAWYLFANPAEIPAVQIGFVDGKQTPTIERYSLTGGDLGVGLRGYIDFGVGFVDPKVANRSDGA